MSHPSFKLHIVTPLKIFKRDIRYIRLRDDTGFFGIMKGHIDFLTSLLPSLGYYIDTNDKEIFLAVDGGIFSVRGGVVTLTSREIFENDDAEKLSEIIDNTIMKRTKSEMSYLAMIKGIEKEFIEKALQFSRGKT